MKALKGALALTRGWATSIIHSLTRESKSNGAVERSIQTRKAKMRTVKLHLEDRLKIQINANHPLLSWLAVRACEVVDKYKVRDGRTAYELATGHKVKHAVYSFGQRVWGMWSADKNIKNDHGSKWFEACVVGNVANCGSYLLAAIRCTRC